MVEVRRPAQRRLLSVLALAGGGRVSTDALIDRFWPEGPPETARAAIQTHVAALRRLTGDGVIVTEGHGYRLNLDAHRLDADEFTRLAAEADRRSEARDAAAALEAADAALGLWRGEPFVELMDDGFARPEITRLSELHLGLLERQAEALIGSGRVGEALPDLEALVLEYPLRERFWEHLMTARYRLGRHTEALRAFGEVSEHLAEVGVEPGEGLRRLEEKVLFHDRSLAATPNNLPVELDSFVGRDVELGDVGDLVDGNRLVTLTGAGGSGKTRLAVRVARQLLDVYPDGVWLVELASLRDPDLIPTEIAAALGIKPEDDPMDALCRVLAGDTTLIVLDNCEHLEAGPGLVTSRLLQAAPELSVIATSRSRLRVPGEALFDVPGLGVPAPDAFEHARSFDSIRLFQDRALQARASFLLDADTVRPVVEICRRLDGLPLAIELAAARVANLPVGAIATRLDDRFDLLTTGAATAPERHQALEATIDWSFELLSGDEQDVLLRLSVFRGGFDLDMAERVLDRTHAAPTVLDLVAQSLVSQFESPIGPRFRLLETIRDFARVRLEGSSIAVEARDRHLDWCLDFASEVHGARLLGPWDAVVDRLHEEADNLSAGLRWAEGQARPTDAGSIAEALAEHWVSLGALRSAIAAMQEALATCDDQTKEAYLHGKLAWLLFYNADPEGAMAEAELGYRLAERVPSSPEKVSAICDLAGLHMMVVMLDPVIAIRLAEEAVEVSDELGEPPSAILARSELASALAWNGETEAGIAEAESVLQLARRTGEHRLIGAGYSGLLHVLYMDPVARRDRPIEIVEQMLSEYPEDDPRWQTLLPSGWPPWALLQSGQFGRALEMLSCIEALRREGGALVDHRVQRGTVRWMQGRLEGAWGDVLEAEAEGINPRWYHDYFPLRADIAADLGWLEEVQSSADFYLAAEVHPTEEIKKVGVLSPLVRASVDRALSQPEQRDEMIINAKNAVSSIQQIIARFPQPIEGSISMETPPTHLALARAEVSRAVGPNPILWRDAVERVDYLYFRLYARLRMAEAMLDTGDVARGREELRQVGQAARSTETALLLERADAIARRFAFDLT